MITGMMTAEEFAETRHTMPEGGRWHELHSGQPCLLEAPDDEHGTVVLNLSRALAKWLQDQPPEFNGYAAHDVGLLVDTGPDTVLIPSISFFDQGERFGQSDRQIASLLPRLVVDVASSNDRRQLMRERTLMFLKHGVDVVWIPDPFKREVQVLSRSSHTQALGERQMISGDSTLPGFQMSVADVFAQPDWWKKPPSA